MGAGLPSNNPSTKPFQIRPPPPHPHSPVPRVLSVHSTGAMEQPRLNSVRTTAASESVGRTATRGRGRCTPSASSSSRSDLLCGLGGDQLWFVPL